MIVSDPFAGKHDKLQLVLPFDIDLDGLRPIVPGHQRSLEYFRVVYENLENHTSQRADLIVHADTARNVVYFAASA
jgi:hypothetical protein